MKSQVCGEITISIYRIVRYLYVQLKFEVVDVLCKCNSWKEHTVWLNEQLHMFTHLRAYQSGYARQGKRVRGFSCQATSLHTNIIFFIHVI